MVRAEANAETPRILVLEDAKAFLEAARLLLTCGIATQYLDCKQVRENLSEFLLKRIS